MSDERREPAKALFLLPIFFDTYPLKSAHIPHTAEFAYIFP